MVIIDDKDLKNLRDFMNVWEREQADEQLIMILRKFGIETFKKIVEKGTPKIIDIKDYGAAYCPTCSFKLYGRGYMPKYCDYCGQRIKWR